MITQSFSKLLVGNPSITHREVGFSDLIVAAIMVLLYRLQSQSVLTDLAIMGKSVQYRSSPGRTAIAVFRCVLASLYEVVSVCRMDGWSVGRSVTRFFFER